MSTQPTQNAVPSESPRDLKFNAGKIDEFVSSKENTYKDRIGSEHYTIEGLRWIAQQSIAQYGYITMDSFQDGATLTLPNQVLRDKSSGEYYRWDGNLPKNVTSNSSPQSSGGVGVGKWISVGDASLRASLYSDADGNGDALIAVKQPVINAILRLQHDKNFDIVSVKDFGAKGDGITDDFTALFNALNYASKGGTVYFPQGKYSISQPIKVLTKGNLALIGDGECNTSIIYSGSLKTSDILTVGDLGSESFNYKIEGIQFNSVVKMTAGTALRMDRCSKVKLFDVTFASYSGVKNLFNALWLNDLYQGWYTRGYFDVQNKGLIVNGDATSQHGADLWVNEVYSSFCNVSFNVAGGFGGFYIDNGGAYGSGYTFVADNSVVANGNRELFFGRQFVSDGAFNSGIHLNDTLSNNSPVFIAGFIGSSGKLGAGDGRGINIEHYAYATVNISGAQIYNHEGNAINKSDGTVHLEIDSSTCIYRNKGYAIFSPVMDGGINSYAYVTNNRIGLDGIDYFNVAGDGIWQSFTNSAAYPSSGTFGSATSSFRYKMDRRTLHFKCEIGVSANGSAAGAIWFKLPHQPSGLVTIYGNNISTGKGLTGYGTATSDIKVTYTDGTYPAASSQTLVIQGHYEI